MTTDYLLKNINIKTFLQIGGYDGKTSDPLYDFLIRSENIRGVIMEPQEDIFPLLQKNYKGKDKILPLNAAIHWESGIKDFYSIRKDIKISKDVYQLSSFDRNTIAEHAKYVRGLERYITTIPVKCLTLEHVITCYDLIPVDMIQIDTEGFDYEIIKMINALNVWPLMLRFESVHLKEREISEISLLLEKNNYIYFKEDLDIVAYKEGALRAS